MELVEHGCALCRSVSPDVLRTARGPAICYPCAQRVGRFARDAEEARALEIWRVPADESAAKIACEAQVQADLAVAYLDMGLLESALTQAAVLLASGDASRAAITALGVLFDERLAQPDAIPKLRRALYPS